MTAVFIKENLLKEINYWLSVVEVSTQNLGFIRLFDQHIICEDFFAGLLNIAFGWQLELMEKQQTAVDLIDKSRNMLFQVTANSDRRKIQNTICKFTQKYHEPSLNKLRFLIIGKRKKYKKAFDVPLQIPFDAQDDIWDIPRLIEKFRHFDTKLLQAVGEYVTNEMSNTTTVTEQVMRERQLIYDSFQTFFNSLFFASKNEDKGTIVSKFKSDTERLPFLGMPDVESFQAELVSNALILGRLENRLNGRESKIPNDKFYKWTSEEADLINWFGDQKKRLVDIFRPYLSV